MPKACRSLRKVFDIRVGPYGVEPNNGPDLFSSTLSLIIAHTITDFSNNSVALDNGVMVLLHRSRATVYLASSASLLAPFESRMSWAPLRSAPHITNHRGRWDPQHHVYARVQIWVENLRCVPRGRSFDQVLYNAWHVLHPARLGSAILLLI